MEPSDYKNRTYLSAIEAAKFLGITVEMLHHIVNKQYIILSNLVNQGLSGRCNIFKNTK